MRWRTLRFLAGPALLLLLAGYLGPASVVQALGDVRLSWTLAATVMIALTGFLGALNLWLLLDHAAVGGYRCFLGVYWAGWALNLVVPGQVGDVGGIAALLRRRGVPWDVSVGRGVLDKVLSVCVVAGFAAAGLLQYGAEMRLAPHQPGPQVLAAIAVLLCAAALAAYAAGRARRAAVLRFLRAIAGEVRSTLRRHPARVALNLALTLLKTVMTGTAYWLAFLAVGDAPGFWPTVTLAMASGLVAYVPLSVNGIGTVEIAAIYLFAAAGAPGECVLAAYLLMRIAVMGVAWLPVLWRLSVGKGDGS